MKKPQYELVPLRAAVTQCRINIGAFDQAIVKERDKIKELLGYIKQWEDYNREQAGDGANVQPGNQNN